MNRLSLFLFLLVWWLPALSQTRPVTISGIAPDYAGRKIVLYQTTNPISAKNEKLGIISILPDGSFDASILVNRTTFCYAEFDRWKAGIYLQPGAVYELEFPPFQPISKSEKRNPYFRSKQVAFGLKQLPEDDINHQIMSFEEAYTREESRFFNQIFNDKSQAAADSLVQILKKQFPKSHNSYFEYYKFYRFASVRFALNQEKADDFIRSCFGEGPLRLDIPPCKQLFEQIFSNYFTNESNRIGGTPFIKLVGTANLDGIENYLTSKKDWTSQLSHWVILKATNDAFYQGQFSQQTMLSLLDKVQRSNWSSKEKATAAELKAKLTYLLPGTEAPQLTMTDLNHTEIKLSDFHGKIVYLHFTTIANPICRQHLNELKTSAAGFAPQAEIINILPKADGAKKELILQQNWPGRFVLVDDSELAKYQVKTFPTSYLIDENGLMLVSPALNPIDGFARQLGGILKQRQFNKYRNQAK